MPIIPSKLNSVAGKNISSLNYHIYELTCCLNWSNTKVLFEVVELGFACLTSRESRVENVMYLPLENIYVYPTGLIVILHSFISSFILSSLPFKIFTIVCTKIYRKKTFHTFFQVPAKSIFSKGISSIYWHNFEIYINKQNK